MTENGHRGVKVTCDVGGTFTDVVVADSLGRFAIGKALTTPGALIEGLRGGIAAAAEGLGLDSQRLLERAEIFVYATTQATNAVLEGRTARTALLCTEGFPDVLVRREGGSMRPYDFSRPYPDPYVPRRLTIEIPERVGPEGQIVSDLNVEAARARIEALGERGVEAVAVCLLWSTANPAHELKLGELISEELPGVPYTLSHRLNPVVREYRRASCTAIDASLKPLMQAHLREVAEGLRESGFAGDLLAANSLGGVLPIEDLAERPVYAVRSGPSLAPVAGRAYAERELEGRDAVVCDTGGTSFDVSLIRSSEIVTTRETWLGEPFAGHLTGLSSVDVRSIGAGGGSIAWRDSGGLLRVGPQSAGADPGPACYGRGGEHPTVTDSALVLGYLDPDQFLGGRMSLDVDAARAVLATLGEEVDLDPEAAAAAVLTVANEHMVAAIKELTINQGVDPRESVIVAGGGAAGLGIAAIARELGAPKVLIPRTAGALSAFGGQQADIVAERGRSLFTSSTSFDFDGANAAIGEIDDALAAFSEALARKGIEEAEVEHFVEARYAHQVWELEIPLPPGRLDRAQLGELEDRFHSTHERVFAVRDPEQTIEATYWKGRLTARPPKPPLEAAAKQEAKPGPLNRRALRFGADRHEGAVYAGGSLPAGHSLQGPALVTEPTTTVVVPPGARLTVTELGNYLLETG